MQVKTKQAQLIDAQNGISEVVYFKKLAMTVNDLEDTVSFVIGTFVKQGEEYHQVKATPCIFKQSTFEALFGEMTISQFNQSIPTIMIQQIDYVNKKTWDGTEIMPQIKFWSLSATDLEIVVK